MRRELCWDGPSENCRFRWLFGVWKHTTQPSNVWNVNHVHHRVLCKYRREAVLHATLSLHPSASRWKGAPRESGDGVLLGWPSRRFLPRWMRWNDVAVVASARWAKTRRANQWGIGLGGWRVSVLCPLKHDAEDRGRRILTTVYGGLKRAEGSGGRVSEVAGFDVSSPAPACSVQQPSRGFTGLHAARGGSLEGDGRRRRRRRR